MLGTFSYCFKMILCLNRNDYKSIFIKKRIGSCSYQMKRRVQWLGDQGPPGGTEQACWVEGLRCRMASARWTRGTGASRD